MGRRFQSGDSIIFPTPTILNGTDGGPRTLMVVGKCNTSAIQELVFTASSGANGWWFEIDTTGGLHLNYGTGTTLRNVGAVTTGSAQIWTGRKDNGGSVNPIGRVFSGASFATDSGDTTATSTLVDGTPIDTTWGIALGRWGKTGSDYSGDWEGYAVYVWNSLLSGATLAALTKTHAGILAGSPDYWISMQGSGTPTDSAGASPTVTGTTTVSDPSGFFASGGLTQALPVATRTAAALAPAGRKLRALPATTRTAAALAPAGLKRRAVTPAARLAAAVTATGRKLGALPVATRTAAALAPAGLKRRAITPATRTVALPTAAGLKEAVLPVAARSSVAVTFTQPEGGLVQELPAAVRSAVALGLSGLKRMELPPATRYSTAVTLGGGASEGSDYMIVGDIMDEVAARLRLATSLAGRTFAYPPASVKAPAAVVTYPGEYNYDATYGRGMDRMTLEVVVVVGRPNERQTRDRITRYVDGSGPESVKALVDGSDYASCDSVRVTRAGFDLTVIGGTEYLAAIFSIDVAGRGALVS
jgi:hypothetical protein